MNLTIRKAIARLKPAPSIKLLILLNTLSTPHQIPDNPQSGFEAVMLDISIQHGYANAVFAEFQRADAHRLHMPDKGRVAVFSRLFYFSNDYILKGYRVFIIAESQVHVQGQSLRLMFTDERNPGKIDPDFGFQ